MTFDSTETLTTDEAEENIDINTVATNIIMNQIDSKDKKLSIEDISNSPTDELLEIMFEFCSIGWKGLSDDDKHLKELISKELKSRAVSENRW